MAITKDQFQYTRPDGVPVVWNFYPTGYTYARVRGLALFTWALPLSAPIEFWLELHQPKGGGQFDGATVKYTGTREGALRFLCYSLNYNLPQALQLPGVAYSNATDTYYATDAVVIPEASNVALPSQSAWPSAGTPVLGQAQVLNSDGTVTTSTLHPEDGTSYITVADLLTWVGQFSATTQIRCALRIRTSDPATVIYFVWTVWTADVTVLLTTEAASLQYLLIGIDRGSWLGLGSWWAQQAKGPLPGGSRWYDEWYWYASSVNCPPPTKPAGYGLLWQDVRPVTFTFQGYVRQTTPGDGCYPAQYRGEAQQTPLPVGTTWVSTRFPASGGGASLTFQNYCMGAYPFTDTTTDAWEYGIDAYEAWIRLNALAQTRQGGSYPEFVRTILRKPKVGVRAEIVLPTSTTFQTSSDYVNFYIGFDRITDNVPTIEAGVSHLASWPPGHWRWFVNHLGTRLASGTPAARVGAQLRMELSGVFGPVTEVNFYVDDTLVWSGGAYLDGLADAYPKYVTGVYQAAGVAFTLRFDPDALWREAHYQDWIGPVRPWVEWADADTVTEPTTPQRLKRSYIVEFSQRRDYF